MAIDRAEKVLSLQLEWIRVADAKVPPLFAINTAMLGVMAVLVKSIQVWTIATAIVTTISALSLLLSMGCLAICMFPRLNGPKSSSVFFGGIAKQAEGKFKKDFASQADTDYLDDVLSQTYRNAEIADTKYGVIKVAFIFTFFSMPVWLLAVYLLFV